MEIRKLNAARGGLWLKQGYQLIMLNPLMAITFALIITLMMLFAFKVPVFGPLLALMLMPVLIAGYMRVCRALEEEEEVELPHLFAGFKTHTARLIALGGFIMVGMILISILMMLIGGSAFSALMESFQTANDPQILATAMLTAGSSVALSLLVGFSLVFLLMLALQYAPMLVFFSNLTPVAALRASLLGSLRNFAAYTVYSILIQLLALVLGIIPFGLGLIVLLPLWLTSLYVSYRNIFPFENELIASPTPAANTEI